MFLLVAAVALSLAAQLAVAKPGLSGWLLSAVPALAFLGLSKLVLAPAAPAAAPTASDPAPAPVELGTPAAAPTPAPVAPPAARPAGLVPVPANTFSRLNGTTILPGVTA
jgi:hypothetical protein